MAQTGRLTSRLTSRDADAVAAPTAESGELLDLLPKLMKEGKSGTWSLDNLENTLILAAVKRADDNLSAAARTLGLTRPQLSYRMKKLQENA